MEPASLSPEPVTVQSSSELFGREAEQLQLQAAIETRIRAQTTVAVHVRGPSGAGKTALVQNFLPDSTRLAVAASSELLVVRSRCYEREAMPFKAIDGAINALANQCFKRA
jgi:Cdc6-like AAA superfamily ATPase